MHALKVHVERAVRPIIANHRTKLRVRNELYAHLLDIYADEATRTPNEDAAIASAQRRFGDPGDLANELQQSIPRWEYFEGRLDRWLWRRPNETLLRQASRMAASYLLACLCILPLCYGVWWFQVATGNSEKGLLDATSDILRFGLPMILYFAAQTFAFTLVGAKFYEQFASEWRASSVWRMLGLSITLVIFVLATSWLLHLVLLGSTKEILALLHPRWTFLSALTPLAVIAFTLTMRREFAAAAAWTSLQLDERLGSNVSSV